MNRSLVRVGVFVDSFGALGDIGVRQMIAQSFNAGDVVIYRGMVATVVDIFPDGVHTVKLASSGKLVTAITEQLALAESTANAPHTPPKVQ